jgi:choline dehydrogenase-like flavoprotein
MIRINFYQLLSKGKTKNEGPVYIGVKGLDRRLNISTGLCQPSSDWDKKKERFKLKHPNAYNLNSSILQMEDKIWSFIEEKTKKKEQMTIMFEKAGFHDITITDSKQAPGLDIHEMGGVRMGLDTKTSMLNKWNQLHECKNVFVTDGACMTSTSTQNPSLTYMALTARAADYAMSEMKKGNL